MLKRKLAALAVVIAMVGDACVSSSGKEANGTAWEEYLGGPGRNHYSALTQIDPSNVSHLKIAWEYHTSDTGQMQCNPIVAGDVLYGMTASTQPFAVNAATGKLIWKWHQNKGDAGNTARGLTYWKKGQEARILFTNGPWLYALDAATGKPITTFGDSGRVSLRTGLGPASASKYVVSNAPGTIFEDLIIMPLRVQESAGAALGNIQAFNVITGALVWNFKTIPEPGSYGYDTWPKDTYLNKEVGGANCWPGMSIDRERGIVYVPTGSAAYDFYGSNRPGSNLFANCLLALDARTGVRKWHFQLVHHDILDRDLPAAPNLVTVTRNGKRTDAVAQVTKQGFVFVFDRQTGEPLFPIEERPVPASDIPGEQAWPTQPFPVKPAPFARSAFTENDIPADAANRDELVKTFRKARSEGPFTPLSSNGTFVFPGLDGGAEWGGAAADPEGMLYINSNDLPWLLSLGIKKMDENTGKGHQLYISNCSSCHGAERKGNPSSGFPSLVNIRDRKSPVDINNIMSQGKGMMPGFPALTDMDKKMIIDFLNGNESSRQVIMKKEPEADKADEKAKPAYTITGLKKFLDSSEHPAIAPPWGTLNAINLNTGEYAWKIPFGEYPEPGKPSTGSESYGGPVVTKSGLLFIAGTKDRKFRAYDKTNGKLLWETMLPAAGFATPCTYQVNGKQYIVIACGGTKLGARGGDSYIAFALP